ncbi:hypothetical protein ARMSODRAFT_1026027 [Armillaria solidipes]|uniref:Retrotransposon gag domain-containing protein n=1 Tax=Armillaria solidipes TaxID=1076256 RepID=A0A2H3B8K1_9AGAR|nr:hypothetical protein ARMSODRAFT_1026027 [Armillaria solidipes]
MSFPTSNLDHSWNATPGPSNVPRTPPPAYDPTEAEDYGRHLRARFRSPSPDLPLITISDSPDTAIWALLPEDLPCHTPSPDPEPLAANPEQIQIRQPGFAPPYPVWVGTPLHLCPLPDSDSDTDSKYGGNEPVPEQEDDDPLNAHGADYEWPELDAIDRAILVNSKDQKTGYPWDTISPSTEGPSYHDEEERQPYRPVYSPTETESSTPPQQETGYWTPDPEPMLNNRRWSTPYSPSPWQRETALTWTAPPSERFDTFHYDEGTFRGFNNYDLPRYPFPLPDSPNQQYQPNTPYAPHPQRIQKYRLPQYSTYPLGGQDPPDDPPIDVDERQEGGSNNLPPVPSKEERLQAARLKDRKAGHNMIWNLNQTDPDDDDKGKKPERGRPYVSNYRRPLHECDNQFSIPRPPPGKGCPHPMPQPIGTAPPDAAYLGIKLILMQPPKHFQGAHDDIERFVGDCITYFEAFTTYFLLNSQTVPFAAFYFEGPAKEWWVYKCPEFWANNDDDQVLARFRYPTWPEFVAMLTTQFRDPAIEIVHECKMFEVRMGKNPASQFFYKLEKEAKLAGRRTDEGKRGTLVQAVR